MTKSFVLLKETQTIKAYQAESEKYFIIIALSNAKVSKTHGLLNKILFSVCLSLSLLRFVLPLVFLNSKILNVTSDHLCRIYFCFLVENIFFQVRSARCHCLLKKNGFSKTWICVISCLQLIQNVYTNLSLL